MIEDKAPLSEYLSESEQLLESLLADLDALSAHTGESKRSSEKSTHRAAKLNANLINRVFRNVHSLKGLSGMMGLVEVQSLAHEFEDILDDLRLGKLMLDAETAAGLQEAGAGLAALVGGAARGLAGEEDFERFRELLSAIATRPRAPSKHQARLVDSLSLSARERSLLSEHEEHRINENFKACRSFYAVIVQFRIGDLEARYGSLTSRLDDLGEVIAALPVSPLAADLVGFKLILATQLEESEVGLAVERFDARVERMDHSPWKRAGAALKSVSRIQKKPPGGGSVDATRAGRQTEPDRTPQAETWINERAGHDGIYAGLPVAFARESLQPFSLSVRVDLSQIEELSGLAHELYIETQRLSSMAGRFVTQAGFSARERFELKQSARRIEREFIDLEERLVELRMVSLSQTFTRAARLAGRLARELGKSVSVELSGRATQLDKMIVDRIADPVYHLLRNAIDHGIEAPADRRLAGKPARARIKLEARLEGTRAVIALSDDGRGIDPDQVRERAIAIGALGANEKLSEEETLRLIFRPGFSTVHEVSAVSGRGVGLDAVERAMYELAGEIRVFSEKGKGTRLEMAVPTTLQMVSAFIVRAGQRPYAVNVGQIVELLYIEDIDSRRQDGNLVRNGKVYWRASAIPLIGLRELLRLAPPAVANSSGLNVRKAEAGPPEKRIAAFITRFSDRPVAIAVERFDGQREIIVKSLGSLGRKIRGVVGAVDLEGGEVALLVDLPSLIALHDLRVQPGPVE